MPNFVHSWKKGETRKLDHSNDLTRDFSEYFIQPGHTGVEQYRKDMFNTLKVFSSLLAQSENVGPYATAEIIDNECSSLANQDLFLNADALEHVLNKLLPKLVEQSVHTHQPYCAAHLHCPPLIPALSAELILTALNQSMDSWDQAPIASHIEQTLINWLCEKFGLTQTPTTPDGAFTSGGSQSNLQGLLLAREASISKNLGEEYSVQELGLPSNFYKYRVLCSERSHFSINKSCAILGLGSQAVIPIKADELGRMIPEALEHQLTAMELRDEIPLCIVATAGTTDQGAIDPLNAIADLAKNHDCWLHVDAAYGGALILSNYGKRLSGIEHADSITVDFHKMFFQPISASALLVKDHRQLSALCFHADYLSRAGDTEPNLVDKSITTTRRFDALKLWMSLETLGESIFSTLITKLMTLTQVVSDCIKQSEHFDLLQEPQLTTVLFRFSKKKPSHFNSDLFIKNLRRKLLTNGLAVIAETRIDHDICLKITLLNPCATGDDYQAMLEMINVQADRMNQDNTHSSEKESALNNALYQ